MKDIFSTAIVRLTILYVIVLSVVCLIFSTYIYTLASNEIDRTSKQQVVGFRSALGTLYVDELQTENLRASEASNAQARLRARLAFGNVVIVSIGTVLCYFFAKKTLEPVEKSAKAQERFTSDASHELRTPLATMRTEIEVELRSPKLSSLDSRRVLESNLEEVIVMQQMVDNLLSLARQKQVGERRQVNVYLVVAGAIKSSAKQIKLAGLSVENGQSSLKASTSPEVLRQIITILLENTAKHAPKSQVKINYSVKHSLLRITYKDNGPGVNDQSIKHIFDRFYKSDVSRSTQGGQGHGLGLSIAKQLVAAIGGEICAFKSQPTGLGFRIDLPLV